MCLNARALMSNNINRSTHVRHILGMAIVTDMGRMKELREIEVKERKLWLGR